MIYRKDVEVRTNSHEMKNLKGLLELFLVDRAKDKISIETQSLKGCLTYKKTTLERI